MKSTDILTARLVDLLHDFTRKVFFDNLEALACLEANKVVDSDPFLEFVFNLLEL